MKEYISFEKYYNIKDYHKLTQEEVEEIHQKDKEEKEARLNDNLNYVRYNEKLEKINELEEEIKELKDSITGEKGLYNAIFRKENDLTEEEIHKLIDVKKLELSALKAQTNYYDTPKLTSLIMAQEFNLLTKQNPKSKRNFLSRKSRDRIVLGNLDLAFYLAYKYYHNSKNNIPLDDLVQIANKTLMSAASYYTPNGTAKFRTYARRCIENQLKTAVFKKNKKRKTKHKPKTFFEDERRNLKYVRMFLKNYEIISKSGKTRYYSEDKTISYHLALHRFREDIRDINRQKAYIGENKCPFPSFSGEITYDSLIKVKDIIYKTLKNSKIKALVTEEDRYIANMYHEYIGIPQGLKEIHELIYVIDSYLHKLDLIEKYMETEKALINENDNIVPTDEEILERVNKKISKFNSERNKYHKQEDDSWLPWYESLANYYDVYKELYGVDLFNKEDKKSEKDAIANKFFCDILEKQQEIQKLIDQIYDSENDQVVIFESNDTDLQYEISFDLDNPCDGKIYDNDEAMDLLYDIKDKIEEEVIKEKLLERKEKVSGIVRQRNEVIYEKNRELYDKYSKKEEYENPKKRWKEYQTKEAVNAINLLYLDDPELFILMNSGKNKSTVHTQNVLLEDEMGSKFFVEDYYNALEELPGLEKEVLIRYYDEDGRHFTKAKDIAEELGITESKVYSLKKKALNRLSKNPILQSYLED